jgi:hypothetical protein
MTRPAAGESAVAQDIEASAHREKEHFAGGTGPRLDFEHRALDPSGRGARRVFFCVLSARHGVALDAIRHGRLVRVIGRTGQPKVR